MGEPPLACSISRLYSPRLQLPAMKQTALRVSLIFTFCVSGSINQFQAPVAVQTDTTIRITDKEKNKSQTVHFTPTKKHFFFSSSS